MTVTFPSGGPAVIQNSRPKPFALPSGRVAFIIIDMQRDFVQKGGYGSYQCPSKEVFEQVSNSIRPIKLALDASRTAGVTVIHTREGHVPDLSDCAPSKIIRQRETNPTQHSLCIGEEGPMGRLLVRGQYGHDIIDDLKPLSSEIVLDKPAKGSFCNTNLYQILTASGITHLVLAGVTTECCVATTFREANDRGFECCVLSDCTGGFNNDIVKWSLEGFCAYDGLFGYLSNSDDYINSLSSYHLPVSDYIDDNLSYEFLRQQYSNNPLSVNKVIYGLQDKAEKVSPRLGLNMISRDEISSRVSPLSASDKKDLPILFGVPFVTVENIPSNSHLINKLHELGAVHMGQLRNIHPITGFGNKLEEIFENDICSFILSVDTEGSSHVISSLYQQRGQRVFSFTSTQGSLSRTDLGIQSASPSFDRVSILSPELSLCRKVYVNLFVTGDNASDNIPLLPTPPIDFRDVAFRNWNIGVLPTEVMHQLFPSDTCQEYQTVTKLISDVTNSRQIEADWELYATAGQISELIHNQERFALRFQNDNSEIKDVEDKVSLDYLKSFETSGWVVAKKSYQFSSICNRIRQQFEGTDGMRLIVLPASVRGKIDELSNLSVEKSQSIKLYLNMLNSLHMSAITISSVGSLIKSPITLAAPDGFDWRLLDLAQCLSSL